jgi:hypothetical protein
VSIFFWAEGLGELITADGKGSNWHLDTSGQP